MKSIQVLLVTALLMASTLTPAFAHHKEKHNDHWNNSGNSNRRDRNSDHEDDDDNDGNSRNNRNSRDRDSNNGDFRINGGPQNNSPDSKKVKITGATYGGTGCPDQSASVNVSPDGQELTILFDQFVTYGNNLKESRKNCNLSIPIQLPSGYQISLYDVDYRGYVSPATTGNLRAEYFFAGSRGPVFERNFRGETNYNVRDSLETVGKIWSACGDSVNMRVNASITARGVGMATLDSMDLAHRGLVYHVEYRACR